MFAKKIESGQSEVVVVGGVGGVVWVLIDGEFAQIRDGVSYLFGQMQHLPRRCWRCVFLRRGSCVLKWVSVTVGRRRRRRDAEKGRTGCSVLLSGVSLSCRRSIARARSRRAAVSMASLGVVGNDGP